MTSRNGKLLHSPKPSGVHEHFISTIKMYLLLPNLFKLKNV